MNRKKIHYGTLFTLLAVFLIACVYFLQPANVPAQNMQVLDLSKSENSFYIDESNYESSMRHIVIPYLDQYRSTGYFTEPEGAKLYYEQYLLPDAKAHIAISHGFTEFTHKYQEVIYYFLKSGYSVSIMDHRGHGYSDRLTNDPYLVQIDSFDTYVSDFKTFMDQVVKPSAKDMPCYLYAHSMGGAIGALFLETYPGYFDKAILTSPMLEINSGSIPMAIAKPFTKLALLTGFDEAYLVGHSPFTGIPDFSSSCTSSEARYDYAFSQRINEPRFQTFAGCYNWFLEATKATDQATKNAARVEIPVLVFQSGMDTLVKDNGQNIFVNQAPNASLIRVEHAKHELYGAQNEVLIPYFNTVLDFYEHA